MSTEQGIWDTGKYQLWSHTWSTIKNKHSNFLLYLFPMLLSLFVHICTYIYFKQRYLFFSFLNSLSSIAALRSILKYRGSWLPASVPPQGLELDGYVSQRLEGKKINSCTLPLHFLYFSGKGRKWSKGSWRRRRRRSRGRERIKGKKESKGKK